jgi:ABC-type multidrug transport system ATPase subunit
MGVRMKLASISDHWKRLSRVVEVAKGIAKIEQISGTNANSVVPDGVFAVVGSNGSGKSSFFEYLTEKAYNRLPFLNHRVELYGGAVLNIPGDTISATIIDPFSELKRNNELLNDFRSTFGQADLMVVRPDEKGLLNYVIGSNYTNISIEEVQVSEDEVCPRFVVSLGNLEIDNDSLSLGEQLVLYIYWVLTKKHQSPGIYFIEEPESGLAPIAQRRLADLLVYISAKKSKQLFLTTHSPFLVSRLGGDRVLLMKKESHAAWVNAKQSNYLEELGMDLGRYGIFYVEDNKAKVFLEKLFDIYGSDLRKTCDIVFLGSESHVYEVVRRVAKNERNIKVYGVLDADQKGVGKYREYLDYFFFLPGELSPEQEIIKAINDNCIEFARYLLISPGRLKDGIRRCQALDHHDFFEELSRYIYGDVKTIVYESAFIIWFIYYPERDKIHKFMKAIDARLPQENIEEVDRLHPYIKFMPEPEEVPHQPQSSEEQSSAPSRKLSIWSRFRSWGMKSSLF